MCKRVNLFTRYQLCAHPIDQELTQEGYSPEEVQFIMQRCADDKRHLMAGDPMAQWNNSIRYHLLLPCHMS